MNVCLLQTKRKSDAEAAASSDEEEDYQELPSGRDSDAQPASDVDTDEEESDIQGGTDSSKDAAVLDEGMSDLDYLRSRMKAGVGQRDPEERSSSQTSSLTDTGQGRRVSQPRGLPGIDLITSALSFRKSHPV